MNFLALRWRAVRPFSFTVSVLPPVLGSLLAAMENPDMGFGWLRFFLTVLGCVVAHAGSNLIADYFDYKNQVDREDPFGPSRILVEGTLTPAQVFRGSVACFLAAAAIGAYFVMMTPNGTFLVWLILVGGLLGVFYTAKPFQLKYNALGDVAVFVAFGSAMTLGAYYVQAHRFSWAPVLYVLPAAFLVDAVLHSNNLRDIEADRKAGIKTLAMVMGERRAAGMYYVLVLGAYASHAVLVALAGMPPATLVTWFSLPLALRRIQLVRNRATVPPEQFAMIDARTAELHSAFGVLLVVSLLVQHCVLKARL